MATQAKRVVGYVAVGGPEDVCSGKGLVIQRRHIEAYCEQHNLVLIFIHHDTPYTNERGLQRAAELVTAGLADAVVYFCRASNQPTLLAA